MRKTITLLAAVAFFCGGLFAEEESIQFTDEQVERIENLAENGNSEAQFTLGVIYKEGSYGKILNHEKAFQWFLKSANQGELLSQGNVTMAYFEGKGVEKNWKEGLAWNFVLMSRGYQPANDLWNNNAKNLTREEIKQARDRAEEIQKEIKKNKEEKEEKEEKAKKEAEEKKNADSAISKPEGTITK